MQNAQMHQMVMQQMMLSAIPKNNSLPPINSTTEAQVGDHNTNLIKWLQNQMASETSSVQFQQMFNFFFGIF